MGPTPEPHSLSHLKSSGDFMQYLAEMLGQEFVWSSFLRRGHGQYVLNMHSAGPGHEDRNGPEIISCSELYWIRSRDGKICTEHLLCGLEITVVITTNLL